MSAYKIVIWEVKGFFFKSLLLVFSIIISFLVSGQSWIQTQKLMASDGLPEDRFGSSVAIFEDICVIGAMWDDIPNVNAGSVYLYSYNGAEWTDEIKLSPPANKSHVWFGCAVDLEGDYLIIGAEAYTIGPGTGHDGCAYIYEKIENQWTEVSHVFASSPSAEDRFGQTVALSGNNILIGAPNDYLGYMGYGKGSVYLYQQTENGWEEKQKIPNPIPDNDDFYGCSIDICSSNALVGVINGGSYGYAYVYINNGSSLSWEVKLEADDGAVGDRFGASVGVTDEFAVIGAIMNSYYNEGTGAAYVFQKSGYSWNQIQKLEPPDGADNDYFGSNVSIYNDRIVVGSPGHDAFGENAGAIYIYNWDGNTWNLISKVAPEDAVSINGFGYSSAISDNFILTGSELDSELGVEAGAAHFFKSCESYLYTNKVICQGDSIILQGEYVTEPGTYYDTLQNVQECDSIIITDLLVNPSYYSNTESVICQGEEFIWQGETLIESGTYEIIYPTVLGCDSVFELFLEVKDVDTTLIVEANGIMSGAENAAYQWINCSTNEIIEGENFQIFMPDSSGIYAVEVTENGCTDTSACVNYVVGNIHEGNIFSEIKIWPNPVTEKFNLSFHKTIPEVQMNIYSITGEILITKTARTVDYVSVNLSELKSGLYFVCIKSGEFSKNYKILKE